jgi:hypothetical protein
MIVTITSRAAAEEWMQDLEMAFNAMGSYRMEEYRNELLMGVNTLVDMLNRFEGTRAFRSDRENCPEGFSLGVKVNYAEAGFPFQAFVRYEVDEDRKLVGVIHYTDTASTEEFPIAGFGYTWKTEYFRERSENKPGQLVAWMKVFAIQFLSMQVIGRDILYAVLEE